MYRICVSACVRAREILQHKHAEACINLVLQLENGHTSLLLAAGRVSLTGKLGALSALQPPSEAPGCQLINIPQVSVHYIPS